MKNTRVEELMSDEIVFIDPDATLEEAARKMEYIKCGVLPVGTPEKMEGIITDRDIVIRVLAKGKNPIHEFVKDHMTTDVYACRNNDYLEDATEKMQMHNVSRLPVRNENGHICGILSFGRILRHQTDPHDIANIIKHAVYKAVA